MIFTEKELSLETIQVCISGAQGSTEYSFIAITFKRTPTRFSGTC